MPNDRLTRELRRLAKLLSAASASVDAIAEEVEAGQQQPRPSIEPKPSPPGEPADAPEPVPEAAAPPWEAMVERAIELLRLDPKRAWKPAELTRAVRDSGIALSSLQGAHFGLVSRLRQLGAIEDADAGLRASALLIQQPPTAPEPEPVATPDPEAPAPPRVRRNLPWGEIVPAAMALLRAEPDRVWGQSELVRAVRDSGVALDNLQGIHFGLTARLSGLGAIDLDGEGRLRLGVLVGGRAAAAPETARVVTASEGETADEVDSLAEEIDACELFLESMSAEQRTAQLAVWAGRARELQDTWRSDLTVTSERRGALRRVFGRLSRITRDQHTGWIDALTPDWTMNWPVYVSWHTARLAGETATLTRAELEALAHGRLRGLLLPTRKHVASEEVAEVLAQAVTVLEPGDDELREVERRFGQVRRPVPPVIRRAESSLSASGPVTPRPSAPVAPAEPPPSAPPPATPRPSAPLPRAEAPPEVARAPIPELVLALTRRKRAVIVGGTGGREDHRRALQEALGLDELDWASSERGATGQFARTEERIRHGTYDLVLFLAGYTSHKSVPLLRACKATGVTLVYLPRGYSVAQVARSIEEQLGRAKAG